MTPLVLTCAERYSNPLMLDRIMTPMTLSRVCLLLFVLIFALGGCVTAPKRPSSQEIGQIIAKSGVVDSNTKEVISKYFKKKKNKGFALDPFDDTNYYYRWGHWDIKDMKERTFSGRSRAIFAVNDEFVWVEERERYLNSPLGKGRQAYLDGQFSEAANFFQQSLREDGPDWYVFNRLAWACLSAGDYAASIENFKKCLAMKVGDYSRLGLAEAYILNGQPDMAMIELKKVSSSKNSGERTEYYVILAMCHAAQGEYGKAVSALSPLTSIGLEFVRADEGFKVIKIFPGSPAEFAALKVGDILIEYNGNLLKEKNLGILSRYIGDEKTGAVLKVTYMRNGKMYVSEIVNSYTANLPQDAANLKTSIPLGDWEQ